MTDAAVAHRYAVGFCAVGRPRPTQARQGNSPRKGGLPVLRQLVFKLRRFLPELHEGYGLLR